MARRSPPPETEDEGAPRSVNSGVTAGGDVNMSAGGDVVGRDKISLNGFFNIFTGGAVSAERREDDEQLARLLKRVKLDYSRRAQQLIHGQAVRIELGLDETPAAVLQALDQYLPRDMTVRPLPAGTTIRDVFDEAGGSASGRLLILGEPGSGKTTMLLELAQQLVAEGEGHAVPVYVPASGYAAFVRRRGRWKRGSGVGEDSMRAYLASELSELYSIASRIASRWLVEGRLVVLLDGLDELETLADREDCVRALNVFLRDNPVALVACCRREDYEALSVPVACDAAVRIRPLDGDELVAAVAAAGAPLAGLTRALQSDPALVELCRSPVFLSMATLAYAGEALDRRPEQGDQRARVLDDYLGRRLSVPTGAKSRKWLGDLARAIDREDRVVVLLGAMQPNWLPPVVRAASVLISVVVFLVAALSGMPLSSSIFLGVGVLPFVLVGYEFTERLTWSWRVALAPTSWLTGAFLGAVGGGAIGWWRASIVPELALGPLYLPSPVAGAIVGIVVGVPALAAILGIKAASINAVSAPTEALRRSWLVGLLAGCAIGVLTFCIYVVVVNFLDLKEYVDSIGPVDIGGSEMVNVGVNAGFYLGLVAALVGGVGAGIAHVWVRFGLWLSGRAPARYVTWLEEMVRARVLYRSGGGYVFVHRLLQEHLAAEGRQREPAPRVKQVA